MAMLKYDSTQTLITDFYKTIDEVANYAKLSPELTNIFNFSPVNSDQALTSSHCSNKTDFCTFFSKIVDNAEKNVGKFPQSRRHSEVIKKFATSLLLYGGPMAYNLIHKNMEDALPSLRSVQRTIQSEYHPLSEAQFQFDALVNHLTKYKAPFVIAISEDATRIVSRVEYDRENDRMVGFVLPCNDDGLPVPDSYLATSFDVIEHCFRTCVVAKYAYLYTAQCVSPTVPGFCLACIGTNNSFTATDVLKRWRYIYLECQKRNITIISFGADGDSRLLRAMKISSQFKVSGIDKSLYNHSASPLTTELKLPKEWTWYWSEKAASVLYIQDYVHVAVKLKARLLKPSIILPMGRYLAGSHHLKILASTFTKDQHGLRQRDLDNKDKQNFDSVTRITSPSVFELLEKVPDAKGTLKYLQLLRNFIDAFLDKHLSPVQRIKKVWHTIFFLRYWHRWLCLQKKYTVKENFVTSNAQSGVELNGHALVSLVMLLRDVIPNGSQLFCPWLLGSQCCEQTFRAARSMTGTFSTIINFSLQTMLQRLHRLQIQLQLEAEMNETGIQYPRVVSHVKKTGFTGDSSGADLTEVSNQKISEAIASAKMEALHDLEELGISVKDKDGKWEELTIKEVSDQDANDDNDDDEEDCTYDGDKPDKEEGIPENEQESQSVSKEEVQEDISALEKSGLVEKKLSKDVQKKSMKLISSNTISFYEPDDTDSGKKNQRKGTHQRKHSEFVQVARNGKTVYIRKSTAIWLFQEYEHVLTDRLFRVRAVQPNSSQSQVNVPEIKQTATELLPKQYDMVKVGDMCVFRNTGCKDWKIGKVLQFFNSTGQTAKARQCTQTCISLKDAKNMGIVCTWFTRHVPQSLKTFILSDNSKSHFCMSNEYMYTLSEECFDMVKCSGDPKNSSIIVQNTRQVELMCAKAITLSDKALLFLEEAFKTSDDDGCCVVTNTASNSTSSSTGTSKVTAVWRKYGCYTLTTLHKSHLCTGQLLDDYHIGAAQTLLQRQFPNIGGFCNTVIQNSGSLQRFKGRNNLQIVHVKLGKVDHWIVVSTIGCEDGEIEIFDSLQMAPSLDTQTVIAQYINSRLPSIKMKVANIALQKGSADCGLYAIAIMTSLANSDDPISVLYDQQGLRVHLAQCFEKGVLDPFPVLKKRRVTKRISKEMICLIYCICRLPEPEDGSKMVVCEKCREWYHLECLDLTMEQLDSTGDWFCTNCVAHSS